METGWWRHHSLGQGTVGVSLEESVLSSVGDMVSLSCCGTFRLEHRSGARGDGAGGRGKWEGLLGEHRVGPRSGLM